MKEKSRVVSSGEGSGEGSREGGGGGRAAFPYKRLMGMCRWMGSHFHDWIDYTVNSRYSGHPRDRDLVSVIARVLNSGVRENFCFKPYLQKGVTCVFIFIHSSTFFRPVVASKERQNFIYKQNRT